ncbi:MAG: phosphate regulon sensor histidine kinase PhoR [Gammaproteobacteria bacterium]|nr:phosphate regulon sensor histidine kinase PhoR [Gammaproteobacteria bacterium]
MLGFDLFRLTVVLALALVAGLLAGNITLALLIAVSGYLVWQSIMQKRLLHWIQQRKQFEPPEVPGIFEELSFEIDRLRDRHKRRKKRLSRYIKDFQNATRALPDATIVIDHLGTVRWANKAAGATLGVNWPADNGQRLTNLVRSPELRNFIEHLEPDSSLNLVSPIDDLTYLSLRLVPIAAEDWLLVARDVTDLQRANQARSDFVANVSHELRTPITVFRGYLEALRSQQDQMPEQWHTAFSHMSEHALRMQNIIEDLLLLSRLERQAVPAEMAPVQVSSMLTSIQQQAQDLSGDQGHLFSLELDAKFRIMGAEKELFSAFSNIIFNAVKYTPPRGVIRIRWYRDDKGAHMEVQDNGIGIPPHDIPRVTERFYRVDEGRSRAHGGTGLGLAIVKHVLQRHKATLTVTSELGKGSTFHCSFPLTAIVEADLSGAIEQDESEIA